MSNVKQLPGAPTPVSEPVPETVELIERLLERAKAGDIRSVAVAYTLNGGRGTITNWHNNGEFYVLMSSVAVLHHEMLHAGVKIEN